MCGIAGTVYVADEFELGASATVAGMIDKITHRGNAGRKLEKVDRCIFGHTRLPIVGGESNTQPLTVSGVMVTFNGEIYNYLDVRTDLINRGRRFSTKGDAEVIVMAYLVYGLSFVEKLKGIFAFALYDSNTGDVILCRDRVGVKPLYYTTSKLNPANQSGGTCGWLSFASELKALVRDGQTKNVVSQEALCQYLHFQNTLGDLTMFKGLYKVMPGEMVKFNVNTRMLTTHKYWDIDPSVVRSGSEAYYTEHYYQDRIFSILNRIIREQAPSNGVTAGAYVSGGVDSSIVTAMLLEYAPNLITATGHYGVGKYSELEYAQKLMLSFPGYNYSDNFSAFDLTQAEVIQGLSSAIYHLDEPCAGPGLIGQFLVAKKIKELHPDLKVMFGGQGGDELFGGYARYIIAYLESCLSGAIYPQEKNYVMTLDKLAPLLPVIQGYDEMIQSFFKEGMFGDRAKRYFALINRMSGGCLSDSFREDITNNFSDKIYNDFKDIFESLGGVSYFTKMTHFDFKVSLPALLQVDDRVNGAFEMESRVPFLDEELIELAFSIPPTYKFAGGYSKGLLRKSVSGVVPDKILNRRDKMGFPVPMDAWFKSKTPFKEFAVDTIRSSSLVSSIFKPIDPDNSTFDRSMWGRLSLALWQNNFNITF